jgi:predicted transcriptional regulator of viral defense system
MGMMTEYEILSKLPTFTIEDVKQLTITQRVTYTHLNALIKKGLIKKIRTNLYSAVNPTTSQVVGSKYQIACAISDLVYISHYTALEYHGVTRQINNEVYVSSDNKFRNFNLEGLHYKYVASKTSDGVISLDGIRITDIERAIIDIIKDFGKIGCLKDIMDCISVIDFLDEEKLKAYLNVYHIQVLYQKAGFLLSHYKERLQLSESFFDFCKSNIGKSTRYLSGDAEVSSTYVGEWQLNVPKGLFI